MNTTRDIDIAVPNVYLSFTVMCGCSAIWTQYQRVKD